MKKETIQVHPKFQQDITHMPLHNYSVYVSTETYPSPYKINAIDLMQSASVNSDKKTFSLSVSRNVPRIVWGLCLLCICDWKYSSCSKRVIVNSTCLVAHEFSRFFFGKDLRPHSRESTRNRTKLLGACIHISILSCGCKQIEVMIFAVMQSIANQERKSRSE